MARREQPKSTFTSDPFVTSLAKKRMKKRKNLTYRHKDLQKDARSFLEMKNWKMVMMKALTWKILVTVILTTYKYFYDSSNFEA